MTNILDVQYNKLMIKIKTTVEFEKWMKSLCEKEKGQILARLQNIKNFAHFGDVKYLGKGLSELRWKNGKMEEEFIFIVKITKLSF